MILSSLLIILLFHLHAGIDALSSGANALLRQDAAVTLITQDEYGYLHVNQTIGNMIAQVTESIGIISVVGPYRTGKSYLLNQLSNPNKSPFGVGSTVQPHTKGIAVFAKQNGNNKNINHNINLNTNDNNNNKDGPSIVLFIDTVGLFAPDTSEQSDARVVALASIISSILIFNNMNVIDSQEIDRFNFIVQYSRHVPSLGAQKMYNAYDNDNNDDDNINGVRNGDDDLIDWKRFQPHLVWVIRDFFLALKNENNKEIDENEWLKNSLNKIKGGNKLYQLFKSIELFTLPRPINNQDETYLQNLEQQSQSLSYPFKTKLNHLKSKVLSSGDKGSLLEAKYLNEKTVVNGKILMDLIYTCVRRLNSDNGLNSIDTMKTLINAINQELISQLFEKYLERMKYGILQLTQHSDDSNTEHNVDDDNDGNNEECEEGISRSQSQSCLDSKMEFYHPFLPIKPLLLQNIHKDNKNQMIYELKQQFYYIKNSNNQERDNENGEDGDGGSVESKELLENVHVAILQKNMAIN